MNTIVVTTHASIPVGVSRQLDTLRGLSSVAVLIAHAIGILVCPTLPWLDTPLGLASQAAVMIFFVLSGFLIFSSILKNAAGPSGFSTRRYAADRFNRICPPLAFSMVLVVALWFLAPFVFASGSTKFAADYPFSVHGGFELDAEELVGAALFLNGFFAKQITVNGPLWSLSYEVWYYVIAGVVAALPGRLGLALAAAILLGLGFINHRFLLFSVVWFAGAGVALAHSRGLRAGLLSRIVGFVAACGAVLFAVLYVRSGLAAASAEQINARIVFAYSFCAGLACATVLHEILSGTVSIPCSAHRSAGYSYTLYIIHYPILLSVWGALGPSLYSKPAVSWVAAAVGGLGCWALARFLAPWLENWRPLRPERPPVAA